ncbi:hypothetical protein PF010_g31197 [Phytophthora fragariae]|nr:hypothetical protein PF009_g30047 [Phytophthora fragariae]KAE8957654.1 hypothetical protein PR002_g31108 [Phytophthora rubi]KAE9057902.1 hypothetical protein PF010_g31197 [Phytophthora fragariae]KAE9061079.1 hypothetical protein PF006_g31494 [Phytophthora fragariae]KAE9160359.1 hypothetical protein PF004_g31211 [Phytophthora fragariae]
MWRNGKDLPRPLCRPDTQMRAPGKGKKKRCPGGEDSENGDECGSG